jgi:hypothetical protein
MIVRRLDLMQIRAQSALACTEDIINLKECKVRIRTTMDEGNLPLAVSIIRQVNEIDAEAASSSEDYIVIKELEKELRVMVQKEFSKSMEDSNINKVMSICPLLQTLGLEKEARDNFLNFVERTVFIGVSADANSVEGAKDPATGYAQALSSVFNSSYVILQQYLPMVIQGMESSLGDVYFIRRLHSKCEVEAGMILKRYMKFRNIQEIMLSLKNNSQSSSTTITKGSSTITISSSDMHVILDELALLIQFCCMYSKYLKQLCQGAEQRKRSNMIIEENSSSTSSSSSILVFAGPTEFDKMVDELINKFYMEGEKWLMRMGLRTALPSNQISSGENENGLDECFFVLHRCGQRAIATNNIQAACAVLHDISDLLSTDLLSKLTDLLLITTNKVSSTLKEQINIYINCTRSDNTNGIDNSGEVSKGLMDAMSLLQVKEGSTYGDKWGVAIYMEYFDIAEMCMRYTDRLNNDISAAGSSVYQDAFNESLPSLPSLTKNINSNNSVSNSNEMDKLRLCKEDFDGCKMSFNQALIQGAERLVNVSQKLMKELLVHTFSRNGPLGGIKFDIADDKFDSQSTIGLLPKVLIVPFEAIINICISSVSESNKDVIINLLVMACCERIEHYISQVIIIISSSSSSIILIINYYYYL